MYRFLKKFTILLFIWMVFFSIVDKLKADDVLILHQNYGGAHTNIGARLTTEGHTVTYSTGGVPTDVSSYEQIYDARYSSTYSSTEITTLDNFVKNGGFLMMNGENSSFASRNSSIASVVSATGGGTLTFGSGSNSYTVINSDFSNDTGTVTGAAGSSLTNSQGQYVFKTSTGVIGGMIWQAADLGSGYTGAIFVTADINLWDTSYGSTLLKVNILDDIIDMETATTLYGSSTPADPDKTNFTYWNNHNTRKDTFDNMTTGTDNIVNIDQIGDNTSITVTQNKGGYSNQGNKVIGRNTTDDTAIVSGDYNNLDIAQNGNNIILNLDVDSNYTDIVSSQNGEGHRARIIAENGDDNYIYLYQSNTGGEGNFADVRANGSDNTLTAYQYDNNQLLVIDASSSNNTITATQKDGENYASIVTTSNDHTISLTQQGGGDHATNVIVSGNPYTLNITQDSTTSRSFELNSSCATSGGCSSTVTQN